MAITAKNVVTLSYVFKSPETIMILRLLTSSIMALLISVSSHASDDEERPNFLWLITEDNSKHFLKLYSDWGASMPAIEHLAKEGLVFNNAFSNSPVCSTARSTLATGLYGTALGTHNHRAYRQVSLPEQLKPFSALLSDAGYYTSNRVKTDYNFTSRQTFNDSSKNASWRNRESGQPFFHIQTFGVTHEGKLHFKQAAIDANRTQHNPDNVQLPSVHPDTKEFRYTYARSLDNHRRADSQIASVIEQLKNDGELENTFIFYFSDHGGVLPGSKGYLNERGLSVPLVIRVPKNFRHLVHNDLQQQNTRVEGFVSFIDFAPTLLSLAGIETPESLHGTTFLSPTESLDMLNTRDTVFAQADRFDEKSDLVRSVRKGDFKYIRNYQPYYPESLDNNYRYRQIAFQQWRAMFLNDQLSKSQSQFFEVKTAEALYDLSQDPDETVNLVSDPKHQEKLAKMRHLLATWHRDHPDLGLIAESRLTARGMPDDLFSFGKEHSQRLQALLSIADLQLKPYKAARKNLIAALNSKDIDKQLRALVVATSFLPESRDLTASILQIANDTNSSLIKGRIAEFLALSGSANGKPLLLTAYNEASTDIERVELLNIATLLYEQKQIVFNRPKNDTPSDVARVDRWLNNRWQFISKPHRLSDDEN